MLQEKKKKRALVMGVGGFRGAYDAGVMITLSRHLGPDYFDAIYASSVGTLISPFFVSNQADTIEYTWRYFVSGKQVVNPLNPLKHREILDLEYVTKMFRDWRSLLNLDEALKPPVKLVYVITNEKTGKACYRRPNRKNIFSLMTASSAIPLLHKPVVINGCSYIDGGLSDPFPVKKALRDGYEEVIAIFNKPKGFYSGKWFKILSKRGKTFLPKKIKDMIETFDERLKESEKNLNHMENVRVIRPTKHLPLTSIIDTNEIKLNNCIDLGIKDAEAFLKEYRPGAELNP